MRLIIISVFFIILNSAVYSQVKNDILESITRKFQTYCESFPREEIFVQSDRDIYIIGEDVYFSIFLFDRQTETLTGTSRIAYFEILNQANRPVAQFKTGLENGTGSGQVTLPDTLSAGVYTLRAYTNWMKNFMPDNCFSRKIKVYGVAGEINISVPEEFRSSELEKNKIQAGISARIITTSLGLNQAEIISDKEYRTRNNNTSYLFLQTHGVINFKSVVTLTGDTNRFEIPVPDVIPGINHLTLFDSGGKPVCETYSYTRRGDNNNFHVNVSAPDTIRSRAGVLIDIEAVEPFSKDDSSTLSISVVPSGTKIFTGIADYMVFGSEFGQLPDRFIEIPLDDIPDTEMDEFLSNIRSKWIDWNLILSEQKVDIKYIRETRYHYLYGSTFNNNSVDTSLISYVFLSVPGKNATFQYSVPAFDGSFDFALPIDDRTRDLVIQTDEKGIKNKIIITSSYSDRYPDLSTKKQIETFIPAIVPKLGINFRVMKIYKTFEPRVSKNQEELTRGTKNFYGRADKSLIMADYIKLPTMQEVFFELLPGVSFKSENTGYIVSIKDLAGRKLSDDPLLLIDGVVINDPSVIYDLDPELVEKIDVVKSRYVVGDYMFSGMINVITTKGFLENIILPEGAVRFRYRDFEPQKKFIYPDYSLGENLQSHVPDFRNTLYWNALSFLQSGRKISLGFFASDFLSDYDIIVQGVTSNGRFVSQRKSLTIQK